MLNKNNKVIVFAQDSFGGESAKTAIGFIRYGLCETLGIVDRKLTGKKASDIVSNLKPVPIFGSIEEAKRTSPEADTLLVGIATAGGEFPKDWLGDIEKAMNLKLNIVNGLHDFLSDIQEIKTLALKHGVFVWDVRKINKKFSIANARLLDYPTCIILTVGTDGAIGKMTVAIELTKAAKKQGVKAKFIATGQTGMMISGEGVPVDAIVSDFASGAVEQEIVKACDEGFNFAFVEGQGSILHPAWSGVTLALLHGSLPHKLILCHKANREYLKNTKIKIESLNQFIRLYEEMSLPVRKAKVVGIGLNTDGLNASETDYAIKKAEDQTALPVCDVVKQDSKKLLTVCLE